MTENFARHLVVPVATEEDARETAQTLVDYEYEHVTVVHVIEKGGGSPDPIPLEQAEDQAEKAFAAVREHVQDIETETAYSTDVVEGILTVAADVDASAIAFRPRGGSRIVQFLSGDTALKLVTNADLPVIALPNDDEAI